MEYLLSRLADNAVITVVMIAVVGINMYQLIIFIKKKQKSGWMLIGLCIVCNILMCVIMAIWWCRVVLEVTFLHLIRKSLCLSTDVFIMLLPGIFGFGIVWLYNRIKNKKTE